MLSRRQDRTSRFAIVHKCAFRNFQFPQDILVRFTHILFHGEHEERRFIMEKVSEKKRAKVVLGILTKRAYVLPPTTALCRKRRRPLFLFFLRETQRRSSRLLRLGKQRIPNLAPVMSGRRPSPEGTRSESGALLYRHSERGITETF